MSPARAKTSYSEIIRTAQHLLETQGLENLSMQTLATALGVRAPSLYKHVKNKSQLVRAVLEHLLAELGETLANAAQGNNPSADLRAMAIAYRKFAHDHSTLYPLLYSNLSSEMQPDIGVSAAAVAPLLKTVEQWMGKEKSLSAARIVVAFTHGFVDMELIGAFRLGGNVEEAFELGIESLIKVLKELS
ncbi:TetR/AcrR family transcriptional regulator [Chlorogloeopsis fritschii PCC 9212]|uniref:TetR family transcriptional regulator n=1 Tax=Chlorogloeopsis fritschii PCC 6912 TaxID=211165 RepID=A0A433NKN7_CHLFR|nr:TetR/AcrR family transcriptional regulator [Chlorogloeopsis fritschii]RUR83359.1 TetR family transcriptional regulator [Chlorogloeopsis fritschii PCC 6912]